MNILHYRFVKTNELLMRVAGLERQDIGRVETRAFVLPKASDSFIRSLSASSNRCMHVRTEPNAREGHPRVELYPPQEFSQPDNCQ